MTLQDALCGNLKLHAELVSAGMNSTQALNLIMHPMEAENLTQSLSQLNLGQLDEVIDRLKNNNYALRGRKAVYKLGGFYPYKGEVKIVLIDSVIGVDSVELDVLEIPSQLTADLLRTIREII